METPNSKILLVTETPPGTPNGFGVTLECLFKETEHDVLFTDAAFNLHGKKNGYVLGQVPYHRSIRHLLKFAWGSIPEWRSCYSKAWQRRNVPKSYRLVYAFVYSTDCLKFAHWISQSKDLKLIVHLADHSQAFTTKEMCELLNSCANLVCITNEMAKKYEHMLGRQDIEVLHNGAENRCLNIPTPNTGPFNEKNPFIICFLGGLFSHLHGDCIEDVAQAISQIRKIRPWVQFHLYGQRQPSNFLEEILQSDGCMHHGIIMPLEKKFDIMEQAHCFIIPSSFNPESHKHYRYSFPTKLPELLASGRPIFSYGPSDTSTNLLLNADKLGIRVHKRSVKLLVDIFKRIETDYEQFCIEVTPSDPKILEKYSATGVRQKLSRILSLV